MFILDKATISSLLSAFRELNVSMTLATAQASAMGGCHGCSGCVGCAGCDGPS